MKLTREKLRRMFDQNTGQVILGGGGGGDVDLTGVATEAWVEENYLSKAFFTRLFKAYGPAETEGDPDVEVEPNDLESDITSIEAMFGFWTEQYISALGQGSGGGGGGGGSDTLADLIDVELTNPAAGQVLKYNGTKWINAAASAGTVTSVAMSVPTGFSVTGSPITVSGVFSISFADGYSLPTTAKQTNWDAAYSWTSVSRTTLADYGITDAKFGIPGTDNIPITLGSTTQTVLTQHQSLANYYTKSETDGKFLTISFFRSLFRAYNSSNTEVQPNDGNTSTIASIKAMFGFWTEQYISALGQSSGGGGGVTLNQPLQGINQAGLSAPTTAGQILVYNGTTWAYAGNINITNLTAYAGTFNNTVTAVGSFTSQGGNFIAQNGGFKIDGYDDTYVLLAGGGKTKMKTVNGYSLFGEGNIDASGGGTGSYLPLAGGTLTNINNVLNIASTNANAWIYFSSTISGTSRYRASVGYYNNFVSIANEVNGGRIGVADDGTPQYRTTASGGYIYTLYHTGNLTYWESSHSPGYLVNMATNTWAYSQFKSGSEHWDIGTNDSTGHTYSNGGFGIRQNGVNNNGIYIKRDTSAYGKLVIQMPSDGECSLGFNVAGYNVWTIGYTGSNNSFGWHYGDSNKSGASGYGWKMQLDSSGNLTATSFVKSGGTSSQFLKADGSVDSNTYLTSTSAGSLYLRKDANDSTAYQYTFSKVNDYAIKVGTIRGTVVGSNSDGYIHIYERVEIGDPNGWGHGAAPANGLATYGSAWLATNTGSVGISTTSPETKLDVNGIQQIYQRGLDNTAFKNLLLLKAQNSTEDSADNWTDTKPTFGIGFRRYWTQSSGSTPYGETTCAGIYATISGAWRGGLVFRTKNNQTQGGTHDTTALRLAPSGAATFASTVTATTFNGALNGNASTATALETSRTIWGQSFNGTGNVDGALILNYNDSRNNYNEGIRINGVFSNPLIHFGGTGSSGTGANQWTIGLHNSKTFWALTYNSWSTVVIAADTSNNVGIGTYQPAYKLDVVGNAQFGADSTRKLRVGTTANAVSISMVGSDNVSRAAMNLNASNNLVIGAGFASNNNTTAVYFANGVYLEWDSTNNAVKLNGSFYATGSVSALGSSSSGTTYLDQATADARYLKLSGGQTMTGSFSGTSITLSSQMKSTNAVATAYLTVGTSSLSTSYTMYVNGTAKIKNLTITDITGTNNETRLETSNALLRLKASASVYANNTLISSDMRMKHIRSYASAGIEQIANAPVFNFVFTDAPQYIHLGTSAQYWQTIFPCAVDTMPDTYLAMDYGSIALASAVMVARKVQSHEERIAALEAENARLQKELNDIKAA